MATLVVAAIYGALIAGLALVPDPLSPPGHTPWYRRVRVWAILVASIQLVIYVWWG